MWVYHTIPWCQLSEALISFSWRDEANLKLLLFRKISLFCKHKVHSIFYTHKVGCYAILPKKMRLPFGTRDYYRKAKVVKGCPGRVCACRLQSSITQKLLSKKRTLLYNPRTMPFFQIFVLIVFHIGGLQWGWILNTPFACLHSLMQNTCDTFYEMV